jgi:putative restriction endonuclease
MLPPLIRKAAGDAGFDLTLGSDGEWARIGVSGLSGVVWILPTGSGAVFAVADQTLLHEFAASTWTEVPLPSGAIGAVRCRSAGELYAALRRARVLLDQLPPAPAKRFAERLAALGSTETEVLVKQRIGQDLFREMLMDYWGSRCAVTGLDVPELLRASHAKPWKDCDDRERLDVYNGLLLAVHLDALFDKGFITFEADGTGRISAELPAGATIALMAPPVELRLSRIAEPHLPYMAYHRAHIFRTAMAAPDPQRGTHRPC